MSEYSRLMSGSVLSNGGQTAVICPAIPNYIEITNTTEITANSGGVTRAWWMTDMGQGAAAYITTTSGTDASNYTTTNGFTTIQAALALQYGPTVYLGASGVMAKTSHTEIEVTTTAAHGLVTGNWIQFQNLYQTSSTGMQQIAGLPFMVTYIDSTHFSVYWDGNESNYTALSSGGLNTNASFKQILYPVLYAPGNAYIAAVSTTNGITTVNTTAPHNFKVGQAIGFRIPSVWGPSQLNELPDNTIPGSPQYFYVATVPTSTSFTFLNAPAYTAFTSNQTFASFVGLKFPQVFATGDVNSGGYPYTGYALYPSPTVFNGYTSSTTVGVSTINGPGIQGGYINATWQGFVIGSTIAGSSSDQIFWSAYTHDLNT